MCGRSSWFALVLAVGTAVAGTAMSAPASAGDDLLQSTIRGLELNFWLSGPRYDGALPPCNHAAVLGAVRGRFAEKESTYWNSKLTIEGYERIRETAYRPWAPNTIPRRFCSALALVSDGLKHPIHYSIGETTGLIGVGWGVEWCVVGLDRNMAYSPACKMARP
ncbi:MAG: hypothetical protein GEU95_22880 [Rhizobiales bacterium]|nr:hypothetical protein [Hyphomicrobiales bacterium]